MLGYLPTTGIKEIKYKIGDPHIYPKTIEKNFSNLISHLVKNRFVIKKPTFIRIEKV